MSDSKRAIRSVVLAAVVATFALTAARADEIYHWIDEDGGVHYSDKPPSHDAPVTVVEIETDTASTVSYSPEDDPYSILNQAARTHERWLDLEEARQARAEARAASQPDTVVYRDDPYDYYDDDGYYLGYGTWYPYNAYRPGIDSDYRPGIGRHQIYALNTLDLLGPRPSSINSGIHQDRVYRSQFLPLVPPPPVVNPLPR
jgi:hypothetical protein